MLFQDIIQLLNMLEQDSDQRGRKVYLNVELGRGIKPAVGGKDILRANYCPVPFMMSTKGYGLFFHTPFATEWNMGWDSSDYYSFKAFGGDLDYYFMYGPDFYTMIDRYTELTGKSPMLPRFAMGLQDVYKRQALYRVHIIGSGDALQANGTIYMESCELDGGGDTILGRGLYGKYIVRETKAPEGFLLDKGEYSVFIEKDETTYSVENKAGVGFINEAMRGTLKIVKTSSDGKVKGFAFRVTGANGYDMTFETDKNGEIVIEGLRIGEYTVSEVANNASAAYITPADQNVTIKLDETAVVKMHNELRDTPKTGDDTNMKLWYVLAGLSAVGIAVTSVVAHKKKKKEGNE